MYYEQQRNRIVNIAICLAMVAMGLIMIVSILDDSAATLEARRLEAEARRAEAEAERLAARLDVLQAQAAVELARGDRAILEAAARSVDSDRALVEWYAARGDIRALMFMLCLIAMTTGAGVGMVMARRKLDRQAEKRRTV